LRAIIPSYYYLRNTLPLSFGTNTRDFIGFMIFWSLSNIGPWFPIQKMRHLFTVKAIIVPIAGILFFIWVVVAAKGIRPVLHQSMISPTVESSVRGWAWISAIMSCISSFVTMIVNTSDYTRFATRSSIIFWPQMITIHVGFSLTSFLDNTPPSGTRVGVFCISLSFCLAQLGVNIAANSISAGCDLTAICPKDLNIRRSAYTGWAVSKGTKTLSHNKGHR
ncbi:unnamed protein product, partial [Rotaria sp. Silwood2]